MRCYVYRSARQADAYLYLSSQAMFERLPESLGRAFCGAELIMDLVLTPERRLASENPCSVLHNLLRQGFHVQLPPPGAVSPAPKLLH